MRRRRVPIVRHEFATWGDWLAYADSPTIKSSDDRTSYRENRSWTGVANRADAFTLAVNGWPEGLARARAIADPIVETISHLIERHDPVYTLDPTGALDVARYLDGEPECWTDFPMTLVEGAGRRHLTILFNGSVSGGIGTDTIEAKGATVAALVELLEMGGIRARIVLGYHETCDNVDWQAAITVKTYDQPLDLDRLTYALAHPSAFRVIGFSAMEHHPSRHFALGGGYGHPTGMSVPGAEIVIPEVHLDRTDWTDARSARKWILAILRAQGVTIREDA